MSNGESDRHTTEKDIELHLLVTLTSKGAW